MRYARTRMVGDREIIIEMMHGTVSDADRWHTQEQIAVFVAVPNTASFGWTRAGPGAEWVAPPPADDEIDAEHEPG